MRKSAVRWQSESECGWSNQMIEINEMNGLCSDLALAFFKCTIKSKIGTVQLEASSFDTTSVMHIFGVRKFNVSLTPPSWVFQFPGVTK